MGVDPFINEISTIGLKIADSARHDPECLIGERYLFFNDIVERVLHLTGNMTQSVYSDHGRSPLDGMDQPMRLFKSFAVGTLSE